MADNEELADDLQEQARLELGEQLFLALSGEDTEDAEFLVLRALPNEAFCGVILEFLEVMENSLGKEDTFLEYAQILNAKLGKRDPVLRLTRFYALERWDELKSALSEFAELQSQNDGESQMIYQLYSSGS